MSILSSIEKINKCKDLLKSTAVSTDLLRKEPFIVDAVANSLKFYLTKEERKVILKTYNNDKTIGDFIIDEFFNNKEESKQ